MTLPTRNSHSIPTLRKDPITDRFPFFYGYVMLFVTLTAQISTSPGQTYGISVFNPYFLKDLNLSLSQLTGAYMLGTLLASIPMSLVGAAMDRHGIRRVMTIVVILFGFACIFTSQVTNLMTLFIAFLLLRMFGQGALSLLAGNTMPMWFNSKLGRLAGISSLMMTGMISLIPAAFLSLILTIGWRTSYALLGVAVWGLMLSVLAIFFRNRPEDIGQFPDGSNFGAAKDQADANEWNEGDQITETAIGLSDALRTRSFWILVIMTTSWAMIGTAITFNLIPLFESHGLSETIAVRTFTILMLSSAGAVLIGGFLADRIPLKFLLSAGIAGMAAGVVMLQRMETTTMAHIAAVLFGMGQGLMSAGVSVVWVRYFGRAHLGKIRGGAITAMVVGSSVGPFIMGFTYDLTGAYDISLGLFTLIFVAMALVLLTATPPRRLVGVSVS
ncbi:MAG: MFS transporter [Anaerolineales bacterium]|nr:MFS transporter [Anaerolineales bacterium]